MGQDVVIYFKIKDQRKPILEWDFLPGDYEIQDLSEDDDGYKITPWEDATHRVDTNSRFYGIGYERGSWHEICGVLMLILSSKNVEKVWYGSDAEISKEVFTVNDLLDLCKYYIKHGNRPYTDPAYRTKLAESADNV